MREREREGVREREKENNVVQKLADCDRLLRFIAEIEVMGIFFFYNFFNYLSKRFLMISLHVNFD